jgi:hypothetical protein
MPFPEQAGAALDAIRARLLESDSDTDVVSISAAESRNRRREARLPVLETARVRVQNGSDPCTGATIVNFSSGGLCIMSTRRFAAGQLAVIEWAGGYFVGSVRHSKPQHGCWAAGIELEKLPATENLIRELRTRFRKDSRSGLLLAA